MDRLEQDQADAVAVLNADALFAPVTIMAEDKGDIESAVLQQLATLNEKAGKLGLIGVVLEPEEVPTNPDTPNPELKVRLTVQFIEEQTFNNGDTGTAVSVYAAARRVRQLLHRRSFGGPVWSWVGTTPTPQDSPSRRSRLVVFERRDQEESFTRLGAPLISPELGGAAPQEVTLTPPAGATAYYTLDGTLPVPGAAGTTEYTVPFTIAAAALLRVVAYQTGTIPSAVAQADFTLIPTMHFDVSKECPHCGFEIEYEVEVGEGSYPPSECPECGKKIDLDTDDDQADAVAALTDRAHDRAKDGS